MHNINLTDETFDVNQSSNYYLLMQSSLNGFTYSICDAVRNKCILLKHFDKKCSDWFEFQNFISAIANEDPNLKLNYKSKKHIIVEKEFSLVPEHFVPENNDDLRKYFPGWDDSLSTLVSSRCKTSKSAVICSYPKDLIRLLEKDFTGVHTYHETHPFINNLLSESSRTLRHMIHLSIQDGYMIIGVAHSTTLDFLNSFRTESYEDILYYTISVLEKFKIQPLQAEIYVQNSSPLIELNSQLQNYVGKVRNLRASNQTVFSYIFTEDILERFANILNLYHCE